MKNYETCYEICEKSNPTEIKAVIDINPNKIELIAGKDIIDFQN